MPAHAMPSCASPGAAHAPSRATHALLPFFRARSRALADGRGRARAHLHAAGQRDHRLRGTSDRVAALPEPRAPTRFGIVRTQGARRASSELRRRAVSGCGRGTAGSSERSQT